MPLVMETPLLGDQPPQAQDPPGQGPLHAEINVASATNSFAKRVMGFIEGTLDWLPFILAQALLGSYELTTVFGIATASALLTVCVSWRKHHKQCRDREMASETTGRPVDTIPVGQFPKMLEVGQLIMFVVLFVLAFIFGANKHFAKILACWSLVLVNAGMAVIMWVSLIVGRPFVLDYVQESMPPFVFKALSKRKWWLDKLVNPVVYWTRIVGWMTVMTGVQPLCQTIGLVKDSGPLGEEDSAFWNTLFGVMNYGQYFLLLAGFRYNSQQGKKRELSAKRVAEVQSGQVKLDRTVYPVHDTVVTNTTTGRKCRVKSILHKDGRSFAGSSSPSEFSVVAGVLGRAFEGDIGPGTMFEGLFDSVEDSKMWFNAQAQSLSYFGLVLGAYDYDEGEGNAGDGMQASEPKAVMVCAPAFSKSHEEVEIFSSTDSWRAHGWAGTKTGGSYRDLCLPSDELVACGELKKKAEHGLRPPRKYIHVAQFGADPKGGKGGGYGRCLLQYLILLSERIAVPLVLETQNPNNEKHYSKYGFRTVDRVAARPDWVLMVRQPAKA